MKLPVYHTISRNFVYRILGKIVTYFINFAVHMIKYVIDQNVGVGNQKLAKIMENLRKNFGSVSKWNWSETSDVDPDPHNFVHPDPLQWCGSGPG